MKRLLPLALLAFTALAPAARSADHLLVEAESFAVTARINNMTVKTMRQDADKIPIIRKMISDSVDIQALLRSL